MEVASRWHHFTDGKQTVRPYEKAKCFAFIKTCFFSHPFFAFTCAHHDHVWVCLEPSLWLWAGESARSTTRALRWAKAKLELELVKGALVSKAENNFPESLPLYYWRLNSFSFSFIHSHRSSGIYICFTRARAFGSNSIPAFRTLNTSNVGRCEWLWKLLCEMMMVVAAVQR